MMKINLKYIRITMYSNIFLFLLIVSGHALYDEGPLCPSASSE